MALTSGPFAGQQFAAAQASAAKAIVPGTTLAGPTYFMGQACAALPPAPGPGAIAVIERGGCTFQVKLDNVKAAGYAAGIVFNSTVGCEALVRMAATGDIPFLFVARSTGYTLLGIAGYNLANCPSGPNPALPAVGTPGASVSVSQVFDGWGYVQLYDARTLAYLDSYAIPEALDPRYAAGFGDLSVHEVATDPNQNLAYLSYYAGGLRVIRFGPQGIEEAGHYIAEGGNNFWGVEVHKLPQGTPGRGKETLILASDRDSGLWIFRYTGKP